jgi:UDP-N-acetylmuramate--alanine ligase
MSERHLPDRTLLPATGASVYLLGIAGAGMSGLAMLLAAEGYLVTGADRELTPETDRLRDLGVRLWPETATQPAVEAELVVYTSAVAPGHPVLAAARTAGVSSLKRARAMGALLNARRLVAVGGTHGKTTVTAMTARIAEAGGLDPIALVGGRVAAWNGNARAGAGVVAVAEADEYDRSFLELDPSLAVVTSVEPEHMECYDGPSDLVAAFREFAGRASERDGILACAEGPGIPETLRGLGGVHTYGLGPAADYRVEVVARDGARQTCRFTGQDMMFSFELGAPGDHNAQNAGAALAAGLRLGVGVTELADSLVGFTGVDRRMQVLGSRCGRTIVDDYAHHPTEVRASLAAARNAWPGRPIAVVFQPHLYSRTRDMALDFAAALAGADAAAVLPVYPAREQPIPGVTSKLLAEPAGGRIRVVSPDEAADWVDELADEAVVVFMGAGDVTRLAHAVCGSEDRVDVGD